MSFKGKPRTGVATNAVRTPQTSHSPIAPGSTGRAPQMEMKLAPAPGAAPRPTNIATTPRRGSVTAEQIATAAYLLWKERGGNDVVNWLEAEAKLLGRPLPQSR